MSTVIRHKRGTSDPAAGDFSGTAELLVNTTDGGLFTKTDGGSVVEVGGGGGGGVSDTSAGSTSFGLGPGSFNADNASNSSTAFGKDALKSTTTGWKNTAVGTSALQTYNGSNVQGSNTAVGYRGLYALTTGQHNTAIGEAVLQSMTTTSEMTAVGSRAGINATGSKCTFVGRQTGSSSTGNNNIFLGYNAQPSTASASNEVTIGDTLISKFRIPGINFILKDNTSLPSTGQVLTADSSGEGYWADKAVDTPIVALTSNSISVDEGNYFTRTITGNATFAFNSAAAGSAFSFTLELTHTSGAVTWPASVKWPNDTAPSLTTGKTHLFVFVTDDGGSRYRGAALVDYTN